MSVPVPRVLQPVLTPRRYFRTCDDGVPAKPAMAAALLGVVASLAVSAVAMWAIVSQIPPGATFEVDGEAIPARSQAWAAARRMLGLAIPGAFFGWALFVGVVHVGTLLGDPAGDLTDSTGVASWAYVPLSIEGICRGLVLVVSLRTRPPATTLAALRRQVNAAVSGVTGSLGLALQFLGAAWLGYVLFWGLRHGKELDRESAGLVAGTSAILVLAFGIA